MPGAARRLVSLFCLPKIKVPNKRAPHSTAPSGFPALLAKPGGCATRPSRPHKTRSAAELRQCSPTSPGSAVLLGGGKGEPKKATSTPGPGCARTDRNTATRKRVTAPSENPFCAASGWQSNWDEGDNTPRSGLLRRRLTLAKPMLCRSQHCLSSAAGHGLCASLGRVAQPPNLTAKPKERRRGGAAGCPSLWLLSLGQARESD